MRKFMLKKQFADLPELLRQQVLLRLGTAAVAFILFVAIFFYSRDILLAIPCLILTVFLVANGSALLYNCIKGKYLCLVGPCMDIQTTGLRKKVKAIQVDISGVALQVHVKNRVRDVSIGDTITLYISDHSPVYESNGIQVMYSYYAVGIKKRGVDFSERRKKSSGQAHS